MPRSKRFNPNDHHQVPAELRATLGATRDFFVTVEPTAAELRRAAARVRGNSDLSETGREKLLRAIEAKRDALVRMGRAVGEVASEGLEALEQRVEGEFARVVFPDGATPAERATLRMGAINFVEQDVSRALAADSDGTALGRVLERLVNLPEPIVLHALHHVSLARIRAEGSEAQRAIAEDLVGRARERALPESERLAMDWGDFVRGLDLFVGAALADVAAPDFLEGGQGSLAGLAGARVGLPAAMFDGEPKELATEEGKRPPLTESEIENLSSSEIEAAAAEGRIQIQ